MDSESIRFLVPKKTLSNFCDIAEQKAKLSEFLLLWFYASSLGLWSHLSRHSRLEFGAECHGSTWMVHGNHFGHSPSWTTQGGKSRRPTAIHVVIVLVYKVMSQNDIESLKDWRTNKIFEDIFFSQWFFWIQRFLKQNPSAYHKGLRWPPGSGCHHNGIHASSLWRCPSIL